MPTELEDRLPHGLGWIPQYLRDIVYTAYSESTRHYHTLEHLRSMYIPFRHFIRSLQQPQAVSLAIAMHDLIMNAGKYNEIFSACIMRWLCEGKEKEQDIALAEKMILSTINHKPIINHPDIEFFLDLDLNILAMPEPVFASYEANIQREYSQYTITEYKMGRYQVMSKFLQRKQIYYSPIFRGNESKARHNIEQLILFL